MDTPAAMLFRVDWFVDLLAKFQINDELSEISLADFCENLVATADEAKDFDAVESKLISPIITILQAKNVAIEWEAISESETVKGVRFRYPKDAKFPRFFDVA